MRREAALRPLLNASDPDLRPFQRRGGKILHFMGWSDQGQPPAESTSYYDSVVHLFGQQGDPQTGPRRVQGFYRTYMVPGMSHGLGNGYGPNTFDMLTALENWVEHGEAPESIIATHFDTAGKADWTRPICPYPSKPYYGGSGDVNHAASFSCRQ